MKPEEIDLTHITGEKHKGLYQNFIKRICDIIICISIIPIILPFSLILAVAVKISDNGPVFYRSKRLGKGFREFDMLKFRTMKVNAPDLRNADGSTYNSCDDPRVTRIGRLLRETSLDEIAQFYNVLIGDMSLIGPRAGDIESKDTYTDIEKDKTLVRPGISGFTQAYFRNNLDVPTKRLYDAWYAHNVTPVLDIKIILKTIKTVLFRENIYSN